jgi:hypothetical protein
MRLRKGLRPGTSHTGAQLRRLDRRMHMSGIAVIRAFH